MSALGPCLLNSIHNKSYAEADRNLMANQRGSQRMEKKTR